MYRLDGGRYRTIPAVTDEVDLVRIARRLWTRDQRFDMEALVDCSGLSRATVYRRIGNKHKLLGDVFSSLITDTVQTADTRRRSRGRSRVLGVLQDCLEAIVANRSFHDFLVRDPQLALRIVASPEFSPQGTSIGLLAALLEREHPYGDFVLSASAAQTATAAIRLSEAFVYSDLLTGDAPDIDSAMTLIGLLIPAPRVGRPS